MGPSITSAGSRENGVVLSTKGSFASIRLLASGWATAALSDAVDECIANSPQLHAIILRIEAPSEDDVPVETNVAPVANTTDPAGVTSPNNGATDVDAVVQRLDSSPQLVIAAVERNTTCTESCLIAACDYSFAVSTVQLEVMVNLTSGSEHSSRTSSAASIPLSLLRLLGPSFIDQLPSTGAGLSAADAKDGGLLGELLPNLEALRRRLDDLRFQFDRGPMAAVAVQRWAARRATRARTRSMLPSGDGRNLGRGGLETAMLPAAKRHRAASDIDQARNLCSPVIKELMHGSCMGSEVSADLFADLVAGSLGVPLDKREPFQKAAVELIGSALDRVRSQLKRTVDVGTAMIDSADAESALRDAALAAAETRLVQARSGVANSKDQLVIETEALRVEAQAVTIAEADQTDGNAGLDNMVAEKAKLEATEKDTYIPLREGTVHNLKKKKLLTDALVTIATQFDFDDTLLVGIPGALNQKPANRTDCDTMFLGAFEADMQAKIADLDTRLTEGLPEREQRAGTVRAARLVLEEAKTRQQEAANRVTESQNTVRTAESAIPAVAAAASDCQPDLRLLENDLASAMSRLTSLDDGAAAAFARLRDQTAAQAAEAIRAAEAARVEEVARVAEATRILEAARAAEAAQVEEAARVELVARVEAARILEAPRAAEAAQVEEAAQAEKMKIEETTDNANDAQH